MAKRLTVLVLLFFLVMIVLVCKLTEARSRVRVRTSRTRSRSRTRSSSRSTSRTRRHFSPPGSSEVTKDTFIPVLNEKSPVIRNQTRLSPDSFLYRNAFFANMLYSYTLNKMPVYRENYNMPNTVVKIPDERAVRVSRISEVMQDINGFSCLGFSSENFTILAGVNVSSVNTKLYVDGNLRLMQNNSGVTNVPLDKDLLDKEIEVRTVVLYDGSMVANTTCRQVESNMEGTVVRMYATNPDAAGTIRCSLITVTLSSFLYFFFLL